MLRRFVLRREVDKTGISGRGDVASGVLWDDGKVAMRWHPVDSKVEQATSTVFFDDLSAVERIHGHGGSTKIVWIDEPVEAEHRVCVLCGGNGGQMMLTGTAQGWVDCRCCDGDGFQ